MQTLKPSVVKTSISKTLLGQKNRSVSAQSPNASFKNGQPTPPPQQDAKPPKKGSFAEVMARAKAAQATPTQIGKIQHKRIEKAPSRREKEEMRATKAANLRKNTGPNGKFEKAGQALLKDGHTRSVAKDGSGKVSSSKVGPRKKLSEPIPEKKFKKAAAATTGYTGTARPKAGSASASRPSQSSTSRYGQASNKNRDDHYGTSSKRYQYASEEEEEEEDEEEENEGGYGTEASSDMEAAAFEVDDEEEMAERIARREDAEALAEENRHKREKEEKRKRLAAMAARARR